MKEIRKVLSLIDKYELYPDTRVASSADVPETIIDNRKVVSFCSNNYLGLASCDNVKAAVINSVSRYGTGAGGSRLLSGNFDVHNQLEQTIARFKKEESAITFSAGFMANLGVVSAVLDLLPLIPRNPFCGSGIILSDELNHASIIDACRFSNAKVVVYNHSDMDHLESFLRKYRRNRKMIVTDGVFSMDGDIAPLDKIYALSKKYNSMVLVDDAHSTGILGDNGRGTSEHFNLPQDESLITMGTFSKSLGAVGGFIAGNKDLIRYLRVASRPYMFSAAMPPATAAGLIAAFNEMESRPELRLLLWKNANMLRDGLRKRGFDTLGSATPIIPVLIGDENRAIMVAKKLFENGYFAPCVRWPAVKKNKAIIRFTVMSLHTTVQIESLLDTFSDIASN